MNVVTTFCMYNKRLYSWKLTSYTRDERLDTRHSTGHRWLARTKWRDFCTPNWRNQIKYFHITEASLSL